MPARRKRFTLELANNPPDFGIKPAHPGRWSKDGLHWLYTEKAAGSEYMTFFKEDVLTGDSAPLYNPEEISGKELFKKLTFGFHRLSEDESKIIFNEKPPTSRPTRSHGNVFLLDTKAKTLRQITNTERDQRNSKISPSGKLVGVVRSENIYIIDPASGKEIQLTDDGSANIYNGRFGWVYEEELGLTDGFLFSPDSKSIAYWQTDESDVPVVNIQRYDDLHMGGTRTRYPKPGDPNPKVRIGVVSVLDGPTKWLDVNLPGEHYLSYMQWLKDGRLLIQRMPRLQNQIDLLLVEPKSGKVDVLLSETAPQWVDGQGAIKVLDNGKYLWTSDRDGYNHIYLFDLSKPHSAGLQVTSGAWDVTDVSGVDQAHQVVYYVAARPDATQRQIYYSSLGGGRESKLSEDKGVHSINMNPQGTMYVDSWGNHKTPNQSSLYKNSGKLLRKLVENDRSGFQGMDMPDWEYGTLQTEDGKTLFWKMLKPPKFDPSKKYPVYMTNYGGPGSQGVLDSWSPALLERAHTDLGYIVFAVDNRGTGARGREWMKCTYKDLGNWESYDQAQGAKWLTSQPFVDAKRIAMYGWSYGGYMAAMCMLRHPGVWKCAMAGAPVTDWRFYDSIYTERYMQLPKDNPKGYEESSCLKYAGQLEGALLLIAGTSDDNVHVQNTMRLAEELQKADKQFTLMVYPHEKHGVGRRAHLNKLMLDFLKNNL